MRVGLSIVSIDVTVLLPVFGEESTIGEAIERAHRGLARAGATGEIVIVDDGSSDSTQQRVLEAAKKYPMVKLLSHSSNLGLARALQTGIMNSQGEVIIFLPGHLESNQEDDIPKLLEKMAGADLVSGWRQGRTGPKIAASWFYNLLYRWVFKIDVHDANWIKCFRRPVINHFSWSRDWHRYMILFAARGGWRIGEVKVVYYGRRHGKSKFGIMRLPFGFLSFLRMYHEVTKKARSNGYGRTVTNRG